MDPFLKLRIVYTLQESIAFVNVGWNLVGTYVEGDITSYVLAWEKPEAVVLPQGWVKTPRPSA